MANEFKITDIVDKKAFDELNSLIAKFNETKKVYKELTEELAGGLDVKPKDLKELADKTEKYTGIMNQLITTQNELSDIQGRYKGLLKQIEEQTEKNVKAILEEAKANKLNKDAELAAQKIETERLRQKKLINQENKRYKYTVEEGISALRMEIKTLRDAEEQNKILRSARKEVDITTKEGTETIKKFNEVIDRNDSLIKKNSDSLVQSKMNVGRYKEDIKAATSEILKGNVSLKNMGNLAKSTGGLLKSSMGTGLQEIRIGVGSMIKGMVGAQAVISGIQQMIGLFKSGVRSIIDFEAANSNLSAILGTTSKNIKDLTADAQRLGAATKYTASEATGLQIELAKLGFSRKEILQSTEGILKFAQATGAELPEAAALAGAALRMFNADTSETERYVSAMAIATSKSALSFSYLQTAMPIVGPVAKAFNFQIEDTLALLGKLADAGFDASMSATATRNILLNLADGSGKLAKALGGPVKTLPELVAGLKKLKDQGVDLNTTLELTDKRSVAAFNAFLTAADKIVPLREQITGVKGELDDMANTMGDNVQGAIAGLSSAWEAFMLSFSKSTGLMKDVLDFFAEGLREVAKQLKSYNQMQDDAENEAVARAQKELATSDVLKKNRENMARLYKEKIKEGMSADEAAISAKEEYISSLESTFEIENRAYKTAIHDRKQAEEELNKTGLFYFNSSKGLSKKQLKENVETAIVAAAGKKAIASITESIIEDLKKVDLQQEETNQNLTKELTDKEKKELEKAERERLKIKENYQQSELDLMDEGLEKELAKISFEYTKRIAAIKGNSEEEIKTRENLSKKMQEAIEDKTVSFNLDKEKKDLSNRLELVKEGSEEELELRQRLLLVERAREVYYADKTGEDVVAIQEKYDKKSIDLMAKFADLRNKKLQEQYSMDAIIASASMQEELDALSAKYTKGLIQREDYEREKAKITQKYAIEQARAAIELAKQQLNTPGLSPDDKLKLERKIAEAEIALAKEVRDAEINAYEDTVKAHQKKMNKISEGIQMASEILNGFSELGSAIFDRKISEIEKEQEANEKSGEEEIERIEKLAEKGAITTEEAEERKRVAEKKTAAKNKELEKQKADLQTRQAKFDKANNIMQTIMNTAAGIMKTIAEVGLPAAIPFIATTSALGAIQLATIIAQPIPKYAKGTDNHPGGLAIVGDGGKHEAVVTDRGAYITPNVPTLIDLPRRAKVIPDVDIERRSDFLPPFDRLALYRSMNLRSDIGALMKDAERMGEPITVNVNNDYRKLEREMQSLNRSFEKMAKYQKKAAKEAELRNISSRI
ncbi:phage tail tape measure protein [Bacteroides fragilis]|mgnify:CR=1 FL=1|jgi:TP901 family phage tail tape measure protein|nr:phage tail tape measure protein [Bacteroides fragilis]